MPKIAIIIPRIIIFVIIFLIMAANSVFAETYLAPATATAPVATPGRLTISEIFPDPKGKDKSYEWVELYNNSSEDINLVGFQLSNGKKQTKIKNPLIIRSYSYLVLEKENLKLALKNTDGQLQLIDTNGNLIDKIDYGKAEEGKSFSKIFFRNFGIADATSAAAGEKNKWSWTDPTKNQENESFYILEGEIVSGPSQSNKNWQIEIATPNSTKKLAIQIPENQNILLFTTLFRPEILGQFLVNKKGVIQDFKIRNPGEFSSTKTQNQENWINYYLTILVAFCVIPLQLQRA